jgi:hypothetical protein
VSARSVGERPSCSCPVLIAHAVEDHLHVSREVLVPEQGALPVPKCLPWTLR